MHPALVSSLLRSLAARLESAVIATSSIRLFGTCQLPVSHLKFNTRERLTSAVLPSCSLSWSWLCMPPLCPAALAASEPAVKVPSALRPPGSAESARLEKCQ